MTSGLDNLSLALFTALAPAGVVAFIVLALARIFSADHDRAVRIDRMIALPFAVALLGFIASATHLGTPANALHVFAGVGTSPLSNEVLSAVVFLFLSSSYWMAAFKVNFPDALAKPWLVAACLAGIALLACTSQAYAVRTVPTWNTPYTPTNLIFAGLFEGAVFSQIFLSAAKAPLQRTGIVLVGLAGVSLVGNIAVIGFDADHLVAPEEMEELDRWAVTKLNELIRKCFAAYDNYEFHVVSHMINDFCVVDLSSFYFDILKDRLYCDEAESLSRRSAQTALFLILDAMTRLFAPILAFTCDEIWLAMPHRSCDDARNVLFNEMVLPYNGYALSEDEMARWARIAALRTAVNGALETARADKTIGKSLEAEVDLAVTPEDGFLASMDAAQVADLFIVSQVRVDVDAEQKVAVRPASGAKCARCWKVLPTVGSDSEHPDLCPRCAAVVKKLPVIE